MEIKGSLKKKLNSRSGFTLAELLLATLILLMVSVIVANGIPAARTAYENVMYAANSEILLSTSINTLRNELGTAQKIEYDKTTKKSITYFNSNRSASALIAMNGDDPDIQFKRYYSTEGLVKNSEFEKLIFYKTDTTEANNLHVSFDTVEFDDVNRIVTFTNLAVKKGTGSSASVITVRPTFKIRVISEG